MQLDGYKPGGARSDHTFSRQLAEGAGELLLLLRRTNRSLIPAELKSAGDRCAQRYLATRLAASRPGDAVLSEESTDVGDRSTAERVWIIDPLDGTREFSEGRADWAVHVALWERGELVAGSVVLPAQDMSFSTGRPPIVAPRAHPRLHLAVSRSRPPAWVPQLVELLGATPVPMGSAGVKVMSVVRGETDVYVHGGGQYEWDSAAPVAVARAAGLHTSRLDGSALTYNRPDPLLPDLVVCRPELAAQVLAAIGLCLAPR